MVIIENEHGVDPPEGYPSYDSPVVQAVARELLSDERRIDYWSKPVVANPATALHAAVRAVHAVLALGEQSYSDAPWTLLADGEHRHYIDGQSLIHGHEGGEQPHGYYEHPEDPPTRDETPEDTQAVTTVAMEAREMTLAELAHELVWKTSRMLDVQWDLASTLERVRAASQQP